MSFTKHILFATLLTKSEHTIKQAVAFSFPVSRLYSRNAWDHDPFEESKAKWLTFYDSGFPTEAREIMSSKF